MSTYYYFKCKKCEKLGGFFTRQALGWGNVDIIKSFQFIMKHTRLCQESGFEIMNGTYHIPEEDFDNDENLNNYFPYSDDWDKKEFDKKFKNYLDYKEKLKNELEEDTK